MSFLAFALGAERAKPGDRALYGCFRTGESIFSILRGVDHHLLLFLNEGADAEAEGRAEAQVKDYDVVTQTHLIDASQNALREAYAVGSPTAFLVRPDGHIAWRGAANLGGLTDYMDGFYTRLNRNEAGKQGVSTHPSLQEVV